MVKRINTKKYSEEDDGEEDEASGPSTTDAWSFEGYTIEFNDKTSLTPMANPVKVK